MHKKYSSETLKGKDRSEELGVWEENIRMVLREILWEVVDWIHLAQDRDQWYDLVIAIMNLWLP
jgi:hypothetical protein